MIAFCHSYKTAGTSFNIILRRHYGWRHFDSPGFQHRPLSPRDLRRLTRIYPNLQSIIGHTIRPYAGLEQEQPDIRYYTFLRDPVARSISHITWFLRWKANDGIFFDDFDKLLVDWAAADVNRNRQCTHLGGEGNYDSVRACHDRSPFLFLRVKKFDESLLLFKQWTGETGMDLTYKRRNTGEDQKERIEKDVPDYLKKVRDFQSRLKEDRGARELLEEANQEDRKLTDWVEKEIWPAQLAAYPGDLEKDLCSLKASLQQPLSIAEPLQSRLHRNLILKPLRKIMLPPNEPAELLNSPWL